MKKFKNAYYAVMTAIAIVQIVLLVFLLITAKIEYLYGVTLLMIVAAAGIIFYDKLYLYYLLVSYDHMIYSYVFVDLHYV